MEQIRPLAQQQTHSLRSQRPNLPTPPPVIEKLLLLLLFLLFVIAKVGLWTVVAIGGASVIAFLLWRSSKDRAKSLASTESPPVFSAEAIGAVRYPSPSTSETAYSDVRFVGRDEIIQVAGRELRAPLTYVASNFRGADASTIITTLPVGSADLAGQLPYWPSYSEADQDQRALYLDWMATNRTDSSVPLGYPFIFFYGLERRALVDRQDLDICRDEVIRLLALFGDQSGSFRGYAQRFLTFLFLARWTELTASEVEAHFSQLAGQDESAIATALAWFCDRQLPLPPQFAAMAVSCMDDAKRGVVVQRAWVELNGLFGIRYRERYGDGLLLVAGKRSRTLEYHAASATFARAFAKPKVELSDVFARRAQFKPLVDIWNGCINDLRKMSSKKAGAPEQITRAVWEAMPEELRAQIDHPDLDSWLNLLTHSPRIGSAHLVTAGQIASLVGFDGCEKLTAAQGKKITQAAALLGFAVEPDLRVTPRTVLWDSPMAIWGTPEVDFPDAAIYGPASTLLSLLLSIAVSDGGADDRELALITTIIEDTFVLDEPMRQRIAALREILLRVPANSAIAKRLRETKTQPQLQAVGRMLVAVAAADGVLAEGENKALKAMFRAMGLASSDLDAALVSAGLRPKEDDLVRVSEGTRSRRGEPIPPPPTPAQGVQLDQEAIARILAETRDVAAILADVLDSDDPIEANAEATRMVPKGTSKLGESVASPVSSTSDVASALDLKYHAILTELVTRQDWSSEDVRALSRKHRLLPGAVFEAINTWTEDEFGDALIEESDGWSVNGAVAQRVQV